MNRLYRLAARMLIVTIAWMPFSAHAGMIATDQALAAAQAASPRDKVREFASRTDVTLQLEALGITAAAAAERVNAMTQEEVNRIADRIDSLPAGADTSSWLIGIAIVAVIVWLVWYKK